MIGCLASNRFAGIFAGLPASFCRDLPIALAAWKHQALSKGARNTIRKLDYENSGDQKLGAQDILKTAITQMLFDREPLEGKRDLLRVESQAFATSVEIPEIRRYLISNSRS
ncbi:hypothetical protein [Rhizobium leguminosarum]